MKRNISDDQIIKAYSLFKKYKMSSNAINIIGLPHETEKDIWATIKLNRRINPSSSGVNIFYPYHGTELGDYCFKNGLVNEEAYNDFSKERRESVLIWPKEYHDKIIKIHSNWESLIYFYNPGQVISYYFKKTVSNAKRSLKGYFPGLFKAIKKIKTSLAGGR
jgi:radical SAM superfamily enzyme YgiQ (UPF0313 family)